MSLKPDSRITRRRGTVRCAPVLVLAFFMAMPAGLSPAAGARTSDIYVKILMTVLTYDTNLLLRRSPQLRLGIISQHGNKASQRESRAITASFARHKDKTVKGLHIMLQPAPVRNLRTFERWYKKELPNVLFLCRGTEDWLPRILEMARADKVMTLSVHRRHLKMGVAIGVEIQRGEPIILVNATAAASQGAKLDNRLLRVAKLVD